MTQRIPTPPDFNFLECLNAHGWKSLSPYVWDVETETLSRIERIGSGDIVKIEVHATAGFVEIVSDTGAPLEELAARVSRMLQLDIPMGGFHGYCAGFEKLNHIPELSQGRLLRSPTLFEDVVKVIATTNTTWAQTIGMVSRIVDSFGMPHANNMTVRAFPAPEQIAGVSLDEFAEKARMGYRNASVHKIATGIVDGSLDLEGLQNQKLTSPELYKKLLALPGIGPYAASCLLIYLGHYDRVNVDSWARTLVGKETGAPVTDKEAHAFFEEYGEWKALVYHFYKWKENEVSE